MCQRGGCFFFFFVCVCVAEEGKEEAEGKHLEVVLPIPGDLVESSPVDGQGSAAAAVEVAPSYPKEVHSLHDTFPTIPLEVIFRVFNRCNGNGHSAANELLEIDVEEEVSRAVCCAVVRGLADVFDPASPQLLRCAALPMA